MVDFFFRSLRLVFMDGDSEIVSDYFLQQYFDGGL